jgi:catechol 2,3-dioxygenase-like lactoylglutathione lyase family enzyme
MSIRNAIASLAVRNIDASLAWYERLLGRPADSRPMTELCEWKFDRGGWLQLYKGDERAGSGSVTLAVASLDEQISAIRNAGLDPGEPIISEKVKVVMINDPDGNSIAFAEALDPMIAQ